jgi:hypothetical protein
LGTYPSQGNEKDFENFEEIGVAMSQPKEMQAELVSKLSNHVTIFSNGMGHFQRVIDVSVEGTKKSIPFKKGDIADALESLSVFGKVRYSLPPSYTPTNANDTSLIIDPSNVTGSLLTALSGAAFSFRLKDGLVSSRPKEKDGWCHSILVGLETIDSISGIQGNILPKQYVTISVTGRNSRILVDDIAEYEFKDSAVQSEIDKAIKHNFQKIKPDSTFLEIELASTTENTEKALVTYKIPVAAWKLRYNIREDSKGTILEGSALVDNCTDEDWDETHISVVTGNPISFWSPDLAMVNIPIRQTVNIVDIRSLGLVSAEEGQIYGASAKLAMRGRSSPMAYAASAQASAGGARGMSLGALGMDSEDEYDAPMAESAGVDTKEVGDFTILTSREVVTIKAKQSAVVPMFNIGLKESSIVLLYKEASHARRPYRALKFTNEAKHDLGKGKVGIYKDNVFQGEAVLELTKPRENRVLPFCLENGVRVVKESKPLKDTTTKISILKGYSHEERRFVGTTTYNILNKKDEPFKLMLEHVSMLPQSATPPKVTPAPKQLEKLSNGHRIYLDLGAKAELEIVVMETHIDETKVAIFNSYNWIAQNVLNDKDKQSLHGNESIKKCIAIQEEIEQIDHEIATHKEAVASLDKRTNRLRENIKSTKEEAGSAETRIGWVKALDVGTNSIEEIENKTLPELTKRRKTQSDKLTAALKAIHAEWTQSEGT